MGAVPLPLNGTADSTLYTVTSGTGSVNYMGITVRETAGATAVVRIRAGTGGPILDTISLAANDSVTTWYAPFGRLSVGNLIEDWVAGVYEGAAFVV